MTDTDRDRYESWRVRHAQGDSCGGSQRLRHQGMLDSLRHEACCSVAPLQAASADPAPAGGAFAARMAGAIRLCLRNNSEGDTSHA